MDLSANSYLAHMANGKTQYAGRVGFIESLENIGSEQLQGFFVGWPNPPSPEGLLLILSASRHVVLAIDVDEDRIVGFITAISDGCFAAYVPLLEVLPEYQGHGIGTTLVQRMLQRLRGHYMIDAICDPDVVPFYERCGLRGITGVAMRNYAQLNKLRDEEKG